MELKRYQNMVGQPIGGQPTAIMVDRDEGEYVRYSDMEKLLAFKVLTHQLLDAMGVPAFDGSECRIKERLDWLQGRHRAGAHP